MGATPGHDEIKRRWAETYGLGESAPERRPRRLRGFGVLAVVLLGVVGGVYWLHGKAGPPPAPASSHTVARFDPAHPYANTPAVDWADGADGIVLSAPAAIGSWSTQQVSAAENTVKQVLIASHLDDRMLVHHDTSRFLSLLAPAVQTDVRAQLSHPANRDYGGVVSMIMSGYHLLPVPIKVDGVMSTRLGDHGNLFVHTNYVFVFPFAPAGSTDDEDPDAVFDPHHALTIAPGRLRTPALLITGAHDLVTGAERKAGFRTAGAVETFADSGHFVALEEPDRYADLVAGFATAHLGG